MNAVDSEEVKEIRRRHSWATGPARVGSMRPWPLQPLRQDRAGGPAMTNLKLISVKAMERLPGTTCRTVWALSGIRCHGSANITNY